MSPKGNSSPDQVITVILGGGEGSRLYPLTRDRAKPAVPIGGKYRLVDIPISLSLNSGIKRIFLLTQYLSSSLHRHVQQSYRFDDFIPRGFIEIVAAQKTREATNWFQGTADAVRQGLIHFDNHPHDNVLILSGDQLYRMDFREMLDRHHSSGADITIAALPVDRESAPRLGLLRVDAQHRVTEFVEKPKDPKILDALAAVPGLPSDRPFLASMGIYVFRREVLRDCLAKTQGDDFGKNVLPAAIRERKVSAYLYDGYWEDIGTIGAFYRANLDLLAPQPKFDFGLNVAPIYTRARFLPGSVVENSQVIRAIVSDGCMILRSVLDDAVVGIRQRIGTECRIRRSILMGADYFETPAQRQENARMNRPDVGIGGGTVIEDAIVDKNVRIGRRVTIRASGKPSEMDGPNFYVRDGIVIIPKGAVVPDGSVI
ncbi:MAG: glucose-1-phosphate adenylyltransferase [Verrucomicrobia bacterium]|nr:glucose-1-phosphate adenylyltransferase [Verrucomicrobiota bacterium]NBU69231.1 glucose-1-phosphate adenylyltransferase [Verrucomicrobiota bacterium]NDC00211.1 glucose-1-phosphate adenylyltransferase [Verrucomicrobiota bacterium]NDF17555.1 glucose-1-phosphate adenylyltransferase [Verrucomicrobiota bacterium]